MHGWNLVYYLKVKNVKAGQRKKLLVFAVRTCSCHWEKCSYLCHPPTVFILACIINKLIFPHSLFMHT